MTGPALLTCQSCGGAGYVMQDGKPYACTCDAGAEWAQQRYGTEGPWASPDELPPGGEVLARAAAGGDVPGDTPLRSLLVDDKTLAAALGHVVRLASKLDSNDPDRKAAAEFLEALPEQYRATLPRITSTTKRSRTGRRSAAPTTPTGG